MAEHNYDAINRKDIEALLEYVHPEIEFRPLLGGAEGQEVFRGHNAVRAYYSNVFTAFPDFRAELEEFREEGDFVLISARISGQGAESGARVEQRVWQAAEVEPGGLTSVWWAFYRTEEDALQALRERGAASLPRP
jgi:ketosteroid isomerase-like protein